VTADLTTIDSEVLEEVLGALVVLTPEGEVLSWNRGAEILFGYSREEALRRSIFDLVIPPERAAETREQIQKTLAIGAAVYESERRRKGYAVESAATGSAAIGRAQARAFDAIVLDLLLPDISGEHVLRAVRGDGPNRETPVIVATVIADRGLSAGYEVVDVLSKPVVAADLLDRLARAGAIAAGSRTVLRADADPRALKLAEPSLRDGGFRPICRSDAESGLEAVEKEAPAAIVLDLVMPEISGFDFLGRLRHQPHGRDMPVIVWTERDISAEERAHLTAMAEAVVLKSAGAQSLVEELRQCVRPAGRQEA